MSQTTTRAMQMQAANAVQEYVQQSFIYPAKVLALTDGLAASGGFTADNSSDFMCDMLTYGAFDSTGMPFKNFTDQNVLVQIQDSLSSNNWFNEAVPLTATFGDALNPFILPAPRLIGRSSLVSVTVSQVDTGAKTVSYWFAFVGRKIYPKTK